MDTPFEIDAPRREAKVQISRRCILLSLIVYLAGFLSHLALSFFFSKHEPVRKSSNEGHEEGPPRNCQPEQFPSYSTEGREEWMAPFPTHYGKVPEKTIWFYYDKGFDEAPPSSKLFVDTWKHNNKDWNIVILTDETLLDYIHPQLLPVQWKELGNPATKKDVVMSAALAMYGGIAADMSIICRRPLTPMWDKMVAAEADFSGFFYRLTEPWHYQEDLAVWFLMARRDSGVMRRYTQDVRIRLGHGNSKKYFPSDGYLAFGAGSLSPILRQVNSSLPSCVDGVEEKKKQACPKTFGYAGNDDLTNEKLLLIDPHDPTHGPELPCVRGLIPIDDPNVPNSKIDGEPIYSGPYAQDATKALKVAYDARAKSDEFYIVKFVASGGLWLRWSERKMSEIIKPNGTPEDQENLWSYMFKDAGLRPEDYY